MTLRRLVCCLALCVSAAACGGSTVAASPTEPTGKPLTLAQAEILASVLVKNYEAGGTTFTVALPVPQAGASQPGAQAGPQAGASQSGAPAGPQAGASPTVALRGTLDFVNGVGQGTWQTVAAGVATDRPEGSVFWTTREVVEQIPGLTAAMSSTPRPKISYLSRQITTSSATDIVLTLLLKTASTQRENPGLIQQGSDAGDATFLRTDTLRTVPIDVYHFGKKTTYWVGHDDGVLHRLEVNLASAPGTTVIDFLEQKPVTIGGPALDEVALAAEYPAVVKKLTGKAPAADPRKDAIANANSDGNTTSTAAK